MLNTGPIEFVERYTNGGEMQVRLVAPNLPKAYDGKQYAYQIRVRTDGWCECRSRAGGNGSIRYYTFQTLDEAMAHAVTWAKRKIANR